MRNQHQDAIILLCIEKELPPELSNTSVLRWTARNRLSEREAFAVLHLLTHIAEASFERINIDLGEEPSEDRNHLKITEPAIINPAVITELNRRSRGRKYRIYAQEAGKRLGGFIRPLDRSTLRVANQLSHFVWANNYVKLVDGEDCIRLSSTSHGACQQITAEPLALIDSVVEVCLIMALYRHVTK